MTFVLWCLWVIAVVAIIEKFEASSLGEGDGLGQKAEGEA